MYDLIDRGTVAATTSKFYGVTSAWQGTLQDIRVPEVTSEGATCKPVVYYSTTDVQDIKDLPRDLSDTSVWSTTKPSDPVTAVAIDCSKDVNGNDFVLIGDDNIVVYLSMMSPANEALNGKTAGGGDTPTPGEAKGSGTLDDPFNPVAANNYASSLAAGAKSDKDVYIKGKISSIKEKFGTQYGNASFYISEDGKAENEFYVFRTLYLGNVKYTEGENINVGDEVIICGKVMNYMGNTPETSGNESYIYSLNSGGGGGGETTGNVTKTVDGNIVTLVVADTAEGDKITVDLSAQGWESGKAVDPATITLSDGTKITFAKGEGSNTPAFYEATKGVRVYAKNTITISGKAVAKVVMTCDSYNGTAYTGNSTLYASASGTTFTICNEHSEAKGGEQLRVQAIEITYAQ
jgi:hypothetical protein